MGMTGEQAYALAKKLIESSGGGGGTVDAYTKAQTDNLLKNKVDKENGKGLFSGSYNDLSDIPTIPAKTSELTNDSGYQTESDVTMTLSDYTTKTYVGEQIANAEHLKREIVTVIPSDTEAKDNIIYMLKVESATGNDKYQEYMKIDGTVQLVGDTSVDLTDYAKKTDIPKSLPANGGNSDTVNNHNVESDVPVDAVFTDTIYDDTELKGSIDELNSNLDTLEYSEIAGGKNLWDEQWKNGVYNESDGLFTPISSYVCSKNKIKVKPNTIYSFVSPEISHCIYQYDINGNYIGRIDMGVADVFSTNNNVEYIQFVMETGYGTTYNHDIAIIEGTSGTYEPYIPSVKMLADEISAQNESLSVIGKCKNLLNPTLQTTTQNGVTCTNNGDGTYTLNGTATSAVDLIVGEAETINGKQYLCNGVPVTLSDSSYSTTCIVVRTTNWRVVDKNGLVFTAESSKTEIAIHVESGVTVSNVVFKPMITTNLNATYDDFVPYTGDGETLTHDVAELKNDLSDEWTSKTYSVGDYCIYKNQMWRCLVANSVAPSEGSNWTRVTIGSELKRIIAMIN